MFDIITIGSATRDVFLRSREFQVLKSPKFKTGVGECFTLGSKIEVEEIHFSCGGGAVNSAITFANQKLKTAALFKVGKDIRGEEIFRTLNKSGVDTFLAIEDKKQLTAYSVVLAAPGGERTIFIYRGATEYLIKKDIDWNQLKKTQWVYLTHLGGESAKLFGQLLNFLAKNNIKIAFNPGRTQLDLGKKLIPYLNKIDVLILNKEEASYLTGVPYVRENKLFNKLDRWVRGIAMMTKGPEGVIVSDGKYRWSAGILKEPRLVDRTGAGDAFGSGFVAGLIQKKVDCQKGVCYPDRGDIEYALQLASANATGVLGEWGAHNGLLKRGESIYKFGGLKIEKIPCFKCR